MSNLNNNTTQLEALLVKVNALPEAGTNTADATATADEIFAGETAYGADGKLTGTFTIDNELADEGNLLRQLQNALKGKAIPPSGPSTTALKKDVNFYDYDGTLLYSYTVEEVQTLTELPTLPSQPGLICQGWNYDLETIKSYNRAVDIGATYITDDGKTRLYIKIAAEGRMTVPLYFSQTVSDGVIINWGDGPATQTISGTGNKKISHTYASVGEYIITLEVTSGTLGLGHNLSSYCVMGNTNDYLELTAVYRNMLQKVELGNSVTSIGDGAFYGCYSLASVVIPNSVTSIGNHAFYYCYSLASVVIPNSITTSIDGGAFSNCSSLVSVVIPNGVPSIETGAFYRCYSLTSIVIPNSVTSIGASAFYYCNGMAIYDFTSHTSVPALSDTNAFTSIPSDCIIKVPAALYDEWIAATNWSTYASQIVAV